MLLIDYLLSLKTITFIIAYKINNYCLNCKMIRKTFKEIYQERKSEPTPAQRFITEVAELTNRSETTVRMWLAGTQIPDPNVSRVIGIHYNVEPDSLFMNA